MRNYLITIALLLMPLTANSTSQIGDILIWNGDTLALFSNPLELRSDWEIIHQIIIKELEIADRLVYPQKYQKDEVESLSSSACWRGYVAEWVIIDKKLYLTNIYACHDHNIKVDIKKIFLSEWKDGLIFASWAKCKLFIPEGECIEWINLDYNSVYEKEIVLYVKNGNIAKIKTYNNSIVLRSKLSFDSNPLNFQDFVYSHVDWDILPDLKNKHIQVSIGIQPNQDGQIDKIIGRYTFVIEFSNDSSKVISNRNNIFIKEVIRIAKLIPDWDVIYQRDKIVNRNFLINLDENQQNKYKR